MIVLWGLPADRPLALVRDALTASATPFIFVDQRRVTEIEVRLECDGRTTGSLRVDGTTVPVDRITGMYLRPYDPSDFPGIADDRAALSRAAAITDALLVMADTIDALVVNRPGAMQSNGSKPHQAMMIRTFGFDVPETLITTDAEAVHAFRRRHGELIFKSVSSIRSIVRRLSDADTGRLSLVAHCPTQFQRYVPGIEFRVHVVGDEVFAVRVITDADDYRYGNARMQPCPLPSDVAARCVALTAGLGLVLAGIDLRRTVDGRWVCLEVNTSPAFSCFETPERPITAAIAKRLSTS